MMMRAATMRTHPNEPTAHIQWTGDGFILPISRCRTDSRSDREAEEDAKKTFKLPEPTVALLPHLPSALIPCTLSHPQSGYTA